jgi:hypothetical protein
LQAAAVARTPEGMGDVVWRGRGPAVTNSQLHAIIKASAPVLSPRTWYVCFFQGAQKFKTRHATFGFSDKANLDEGAMWPTAFALGR